MSDIEKLLKRMEIIVYPETMIAVNGEIKGTAFFPGGKGTYQNDDSLSNKEIMILGQDFDCEKNYNKALNIGYEDPRKNATWRNLLNFLNEVQVSPNDCFFTNAILGIRKGDKGTGKSPAFKDKDFIQTCQEFFYYQLEVLKPKVIFAFGIQVAKFLSSTSPDLECWRKIGKFPDIDDNEIQVVNTTFNNGIKSKVAVLTHPSLRNVNVKGRKYKQFGGHDAELNLVNDILKST